MQSDPSNDREVGIWVEALPLGGGLFGAVGGVVWNAAQIGGPTSDVFWWIFAAMFAGVGAFLGLCAGYPLGWLLLLVHSKKRGRP